MNLYAFFNLVEQSESFKKNSVYMFTGLEYPVLFFSTLKSYVEKHFPAQSRTVDITQIDVEQIKGQLSVPFLGSSLLYWCGNIADLDARAKKNFFSFIETYHGPHCILFFADVKNKTVINADTVKTVELAQNVSYKEWQELSHRLFVVSKSSTKVLQKICMGIKAPLSLDAICLLTHYSSLIGSSSLSTFLNEWLETLIVPEKSLFSLSTYFFAKNHKLFFSLWIKLKDEYPPQFWIAYWSEQLFRATCFVKLARANKFLEAKKIAYRLPFTLIKSDWRNLSSKQLAQAHNFLYEIDYRLKNGGQPFCLDLFYSHFFEL